MNDDTKEQAEGAANGGCAIVGDFESFMREGIQFPNRPKTVKASPEELKELCARYNDKKEFKSGDIVCEKAGLESYRMFDTVDYAVFVDYIPEELRDNDGDSYDCFIGVTMEIPGKKSLVLYPCDSKRFDHYRP